MPRQNLALKKKMLGKTTQTEVARLLGCRVEHVNRVLNGKRQSRRVVRFIEQLLHERNRA